LASLILFGVFFVPAEAKAGFFASLFANDAFAEVSTVEPSSEADVNSQNIGLLAVNVPSASIFEYKGKVANAEAEVNITDNALMPELPPMMAMSGKASNITQDGIGGPDTDLSVYVVRKGDSISQIAEMFDVSVNTILWANGMKKGEKLVEGDVLIILPVSGLRHTVAKGENLQSIAKKYKADPDEILLYNDIDGSKLAVGDQLLIPDGEMMANEGGNKPAANLSTAVARDKNYYASHPIKSVDGYFINPLPNGQKTQGLHGPGKRGIDIGAPRGTNLYAAASGTVTAVITECSEGVRKCGGGYGNMVVIQHPNGTKTLYGHMSKVFTHNGAQVKQGDVIGLVGSTGHSTGPHVHFEVFNAQNPGAKWTWKK